MKLNENKISNLEEMGVKELEMVDQEQTNGGLSLSLGGPIVLGGTSTIPLLGAISFGTNLMFDIDI